MTKGSEQTVPVALYWVNLKVDLGEVGYELLMLFTLAICKFVPLRVIL